MPVDNVEQTITPDRTEATTPEELHPVAAAFGGEIGEALQKSGEQVASRIEQLSQHMYMMNYWRGMQTKQDLLTQYKTATQDKLFNAPGTVTLPRNIGGDAINPDTATLSTGQAPSNTAPDADQQTFETPAAIFERKGNQAYGALAEYDQWHVQAKNQLIEQAKQAGLGARNLRGLVAGIDSDYASNRNLISKHEAQQLDQSQQQSFMKGMQLDADNAVTKQDPVSLGRTIDSINESNQNLNDSQGKDPQDPVRDLTANKFIGQALHNSMVATLKSTGGDPTQFQNTLDKLKDSGKINDTVYEDVSEKLDKTSKAMIAQNETVVKTQMVNNRMNTMQSALQHKLDLSNPATVSEISAQDPELGTALSNYSLNKNDNIKDEDTAFADATEKIFSAGSKEQISKYSMNVLKEGKLSQDRLNILFSSAMERGKNLADLEGQTKNGNPLQNMIDGGVKAILKWGKATGLGDSQTLADFMIGVKNKPVAEAHNDAITNTIVRNHPAVAAMSTPPNMVITGKNDIKYIFPRTHRKEDGTDTNNE